MEPSDEKQLSVPQAHDFEVFDLADEEQIIAEISGRVTEKYVYTFKQGGQEVTGLSYAGTNWACREYAKHGEVIRVIGKPEIVLDPTDPNYIVVVVTSQRFAINQETQRETPLDTTLGVKRQWRMMKKNKYENGQVVGEEIVPDPFFVEKAFSKAIRNSKQALMPVDLVKRLISEAIKIKHSGPPRSGSTPPKAPPAAPAKAAAPQQQPQKPAAAAPSTAAAPPPADGTAAKPAASQSAAAPAASAKPVQSKDTLIQKFEIVLKTAFNTQDGGAARQGLKKIAGTDKIGDLSEGDLKKYGKVLQGVTKGTYKIADDGTHIVDAKTNEIVWGTKPEPAPAPQQGNAAPVKADEEFF
jgi:hypothetical protein